MKRLLPAFQDAISFLTILPLGPVRWEPEEDRRRLGLATAWFPLVGAGIGAAGAWVAGWADSFWPPAVATLLGWMSAAILTGGLHWDGFCDSVDGLAARASPEMTLQVMRDSRVGALGALAGVGMVALQWSLLQAIPFHRILPAWAAAGAVSRWAMVGSAYFFPYAAGQQGLGRLVTDRKNRSSAVAAAGLGIGFALCGLGVERAGIALAAAAVSAWLMNRLFLSRVGGITGDTLGAVCVVTETIVLSVAAVR